VKTHENINMALSFAVDELKDGGVACSFRQKAILDRRQLFLVKHQGIASK
jgi:hypothetical protein